MVFKREAAITPLPEFEMQLPCGNCIGCKLERSRQWAARCVHEASLYERNCFLTLTYSPENLPMDESLDHTEFQRFMKRLRKHFGANKENPIRYFHAGEYGDLKGRPHYHAIIFNLDFEDKVLYEFGENPTYTSPTLTKIWGLGLAVIGAVTFQSAAYVARYCLKKITGEKAEEHYQGRKPEYTTMSRRPGIGAGWFDKWKGDIFPSDNLVVKGVCMRPPRFYDGLFEREAPSTMEKIRSRRMARASSVDAEEKANRIGYTAEEVKRAQIRALSRKQDATT